MYYTKKFNITAPDNHQIPIYYYKNNFNSGKSPIGIIQIIHGMSEHYEYYTELVSFFISKGFDIYIHDQRGHGSAVNQLEDLGFIANSNGCRKLSDDAILISEYIKKAYPQTPLYLFAHSFGTLIALQMAINLTKVHYFNKIILCGAPGHIPTWQAKLGKFIMKLCIRMQDKKNIHSINPLAKKLFEYGFDPTFNKRNKNFQWVTRDQFCLEKYAHDKFAGFTPSNQFFLDLLLGYEYITSNLKKINKNSDFVFFCGAQDPVSNYTKQVKTLIKKLQNNNINQIQHVFYPNAKHSLYIDINRNEFFYDMLKLLNNNRQ